MIPDGWQVCTLEDLGRWVGGGTPSKRNLTFWKNGTVPWLSSKDMKNKYLFDSQDKISIEAANSSATAKVPEGAIVLVTRSGILRHTLPFGVARREITINQDLKALIPKQKGASEFLFHLFDHHVDKIRKTCMKDGTTVESIQFPLLKKYQVLIPTTQEQKKIAEILSIWDKAIEVTEKIKSVKTKYFRLCLNRLMNPSEGNREKYRLPDIGKLRKGKGISKAEIKDTGIPAVRYAELYTTHHYFIKTIQSFINQESANLAEPIKCGDIIFAGSGEKAEEIGKCAVYLGNKRAYAGGDAIILSPNKSLVDSTFLSFLFSSSYIRRQMYRLSKGDTVVHLYKGDLEKIEISLPPLATQKKIANYLESLDKEIEKLTHLKKLLTTQKQGMMQQLLTGKKRISYV